MVGYKYLLCALLLASLSGITQAQNNTNSPYTRYGFGQLADQGFGNSKAMGGIAYGLRDGTEINVLNPASYTAIDSLTFLFSGGLTVQNTNFSSNGIKMNAKNSSFDYIAMQFRLGKRIAVSAGFVPFSSVGYSMSETKTLNDKETTATSVYSGDGGIHQLFAGAGFKILKNLSVGANISYLYGTVTHSVTTTYSDGSAFTAGIANKIEVRDYKLDLGAQYTHNFGKDNSVTLGLVYSMKHGMHGDAYRNTSASGVSGDTIKNGFDFPNMFGAGFTYKHKNNLTIGFDYTFQQWSKAKYYEKDGFFTDRSKYAVGAEFIPNPVGRNYFSRIKYRVGAYYSNPYIKVNEMKGADEYGVSAGFGLPVFQNKSLVNFSAQFVKVNGKNFNLVDETYMKFSIGITFNERWFLKTKVQ